MFSAVREQIARFFLSIANFFGYRSHIQRQFDEDTYVLDMSPEEFAEYDRVLTIGWHRGGKEEVQKIMREYSSRNTR